MSAAIRLLAPCALPLLLAVAAPPALPALPAPPATRAPPAPPLPAWLAFPAPGARPVAAELPGRAQAWDALLREHVRDGLVDYAALHAEPAPLDAALAALSATDPAALGRDAALAFWVNAYNAFTLRLILDHWTDAGPSIDGIKDIPAGRRWTARRWEVGGERYSLDQIEHEILRPMGEPRVHFVLVCASRSCPDLSSEALDAARIDSQLDAAARRLLADPTKGLAFGDEPGLLWGRNHVLRLSRIFDWFADDFGADRSALLDFVLRHAPPDAAAYIRRHRDDLDIEHFEYDWSLNAQRS